MRKEIQAITEVQELDRANNFETEIPDKDEAEELTQKEKVEKMEEPGVESEEDLNSEAKSETIDNAHTSMLANHGTDSEDSDEQDYPPNMEKGRQYYLEKKILLKQH